MKKKLIIIGSIILFIGLVILSCKTIKIEKVDVNSPDTQEKSLATEEILIQVLRGEKEFIDYSGNEINISGLKIEDANVKVNSYVFVDIDNDNENELIAITDSYFGYYLVLDIDSNIIYGYNISLNDMDYINTKGIILDNVDDSIYYRRLKFNKNKYKKINVASYSSDEYMVDGEVVEKEAFDDFTEKFIEEKLVKYRVSSNNWMVKKINNDFSIKAEKTYGVFSDDSEYVFSIDKNFENIRRDLLDETINMYYMDSNSNSGRIIIKRTGDNYDKFSDELNNKKCVGIYDEDSQYIAVILNNDRFSSSFDNTYEIYHFKYYNKNIQFLGHHNVTDYTTAFSDDLLSELE